eukprot:14945974-Alexandrium_andersonii.AAC.1
MAAGTWREGAALPSGDRELPDASGHGPARSRTAPDPAWTSPSRWLGAGCAHAASGTLNACLELNAGSEWV